MVIVSNQLTPAGGGASTGELIQIDPSDGSQATISSGGELGNTVDVLAEPGGDLLALNQLSSGNTAVVIQILINLARNVISGNSAAGIEISAPPGQPSSRAISSAPTPLARWRLPTLRASSLIPNLTTTRSAERPN